MAMFHMFTAARQRREADRKERLEDLFRKADERQEGRLTAEQVGQWVSKTRWETHQMDI